MEDGKAPHFAGNLSHKIVSIAAGESHALALTGDGRVYSWGRGMFGRLGTNSESDENIPVPVEFKLGEDGETPKFVGIAAGAYHSLALQEFVLSFFLSLCCNLFLDLYMDGQLGVTRGGENALVPTLLDQFIELCSTDRFNREPQQAGENKLKVCSVKAGGMMSLAIDSLGALWMWGNCPPQSCSDDGVYSLVIIPNPIPVWDFHGHRVVKVACGNEHVVALVTAGEAYKGDELICYSWGMNSHGQLGVGDKEPRSHPVVVETFNQESNLAAYEVACGAFHTAVLSQNKRPSEVFGSVCWTFGLGDKGQLGHGTTQSSLFPKLVEGLPKHVFLVSVDCGLFHTSIVSRAGDVWSWGMEKGLGLFPDATFAGTDSGDSLSPIMISSGGFPDPVQIACGAAHTILVAHDGYRLWSWGRGRSGVLGNGNTVDCLSPSVVLWPPLNKNKEEELRADAGKDKMGGKSGEEVIELERRLSLAVEEIGLLHSKLSVMERYASILHGAIFGKPFEEHDIPTSLQNSGFFDITKEWENMLESADRSKLLRLEGFYRNMIAGVKDKLMKERIQELIRECLSSSENSDTKKL
ncbi:Regulator of chromosome condensation, RCC1 [Dillenia turbinata]|uniref:Regulator of chromosome condensation, RCC1 n=1 Tax=Dillenia turbinata TaxID=194707 RepID=A0AAN8YRL7_9MAGN